MANRMTTLTSERGTTLIETMIALSVLLAVMGGLITISAVASTTPANNGHLAARPRQAAPVAMRVHARVRPRGGGVGGRRPAEPGGRRSHRRRVHPAPVRRRHLLRQ